MNQITLSFDLMLYAAFAQVSQAKKALQSTMHMYFQKKKKKLPPFHLDLQKACTLICKSRSRESGLGCWLIRTVAKGFAGCCRPETMHLEICSFTITADNT